MRPTLRQMQYIVAVHQLGSFGLAAEAMHVSQPSLSNQIAAVEAELKIRLFERGRGGVQTTAKGLEFRAVAVMGCDDNVIPSRERIEDLADESDIVEVTNTERHLLYVACTRARDHLLLTCITPGSEFLDDMSLSTK